MLEQIIDNIIQSIRTEVVQPGMQQIPLTYIFTRNIPDSIKHFFDQEVELWIREETEKFGSSERFDYEMPEVRVLVDKIFDTLKQTATFNINQFNRLLERAIKLEANYLIRPHQTLAQFLFKDNFVITTIEVYDMLKYFDKFQYYKDALTNYFNIKYLREISQTQFEELIKGIDLQVFSRTPVDSAMQTIKTINNFINEGRQSPSESISTRILSMTFRDRNLLDFAYAVERELQNGVEDIPVALLDEMLRTNKTLAELEAALAVPEPEPREFRLENIVDIEEEKPDIEVESLEVPEQTEVYQEEQELQEEEEEDYYEEEEDEEEVIATSPAPARTVTKQDSASMAADQLANILGEKMKGERLIDLDHVIPVKMRKKFIKKIFKKKENQYLEIINLLNNTPSWKNASNLIDTFFYQQGINPYSREALEFSDLVYNRYYPKDIGVNKGHEFRH